MVYVASDPRTSSSGSGYGSARWDVNGKDEGSEKGY